MKPADPKIIDESYYLNVCFGSEDFKKSGGKKIHPRVKNMIDEIGFNNSMSVLEIGCGRGDTSMYIATKVKSITAIDYSEVAIKMANDVRGEYPVDIQERAKFYVMNATSLHKFKDKSFEVVIFIDTIDHLNKKGVNAALSEINRVLKPGGILFVRTCSNRILLNYTFKYYVYPMNLILTQVDKMIKRVSYSSLAKDQRTKDAKIHHINEPDYFYLKKAFNKAGFIGRIRSEIGFIKEGGNLRSRVYNFIISLYPISKSFPLNVLFGYSFNSKLSKK